MILALLGGCKNAKPTEVDSSEVSSSQDNFTENIDTVESKGVNLPPIIWLGDSLTQGSLGDDNGNENNPQAPWRVIAKNHEVNIIGYGYYGYNTHDIFWKFGEDGGQKKSENIYVFWVGSNDFVQSEDAITDVIGEINRFIDAGIITEYIVIGTTDREELGRNKAVAINEVFKNTYGSKYLDILNYVEYGPDGIHLTENSYYKIGEAVYSKIVDIYQ